MTQVSPVLAHGQTLDRLGDALDSTLWGYPIDVAQVCWHRDSMGRRRSKIAGSAVAAFAVGVALAVPAHADTDSERFIDYLDSRGQDVRGIEYEVIDLGNAVCGIFDAGASVDDVFDSLHQDDDAAWIVGSVNYLCPQNKYLIDDY